MAGLDPPDALVDAMQAGDRLSYYPERAQQEIAHFHEVLPRAQAAIADIGASINQRMEDYVKRFVANNWRPANIDMEAQKKHRMDAMAQAGILVMEAGK